MSGVAVARVPPSAATASAAIATAGLLGPIATTRSPGDRPSPAKAVAPLETALRSSRRL
jgi:hypothetical protein